MQGARNTMTTRREGQLTYSAGLVLLLENPMGRSTSDMKAQVAKERAGILHVEGQPETRKWKTWRTYVAL